MLKKVFSMFKKNKYTRKCKSCGLKYKPGREPDPCLGYLPAVKYACCGHGGTKGAYIMFENNTLIRGHFYQIEKIKIIKEEKRKDGSKKTHKRITQTNKKNTFREYEYIECPKGDIK